MSRIYFDNKTAYDWNRYKDGFWIPHRKRVFLYWFKYLQQAELSPRHNVDWTKYDGWGGANAVLGMKFDNWWDDNWKELFGTKDRSETPKFPISTTRVKTEALRLSLLCWERRDAPVWGKRGNALSIAKQVYEYELGISGEKKPRYTDENFDASFMNPEEEDVSHWDNDELPHKQRLQSIVSRYLKNARKYLANVCKGQFP
jgi:hypothetical protein